MAVFHLFTHKMLKIPLNDTEVWKRAVTESGYNTKTLKKGKQDYAKKCNSSETQNKTKINQETSKYI